MRKLLLTYVLSLISFAMFAQEAGTPNEKENTKAELKASSDNNGAKHNYKDAKSAPVKYELKSKSNNGGVLNKEEILEQRAKNSEDESNEPTLSNGSNPKQNNTK